MTAKEVIKNTIDMGHMILTTYLGDLADSDLMIRPVAGVNHIAWQMGHLISSEHEMLTKAGCSMPDLPDGFAACYTKETATSDDPAKFHNKAELLKILDSQRAGTLAALDAASDEDLKRATPEEMHAYAPTVGAVFNMIGLHTLMHAPQIIPVRRMQGKPVLI